MRIQPSSRSWMQHQFRGQELEDARQFSVSYNYEGKVAADDVLLSEHHESLKSHCRKITHGWQRDTR